MLRWMAPFLSFTAEEAWQLFGPNKEATDTIFTETYTRLPEPDAALLAKWARVRAVREVVNKEIEAVRGTGAVGASLQATVQVTLPAQDHAVLASLGDDLKFVFITSAASLAVGDALQVVVTPSTAPKCERCWHYRDDVGSDAAHPTICGRCASNLFGSGETRTVA